MKKTKVEFGSLLSYTPRGDKTIHYESRNIMIQLKNDKPSKKGILFSDSIAEMIKKNLSDYKFSDYFGKDVTLIPTPRSSRLPKDGLWVPKRLTIALEKQGLGKSEECLFREIPLPKSSSSEPANRPKAQRHYESFSVKKLLFTPKEIVLVDDVITRGATVLGAVNRLLEVFPTAEIRVFAVMRTISMANQFTDCVEPCVGTVSLSNEDTFRRP